MKKAIGIITQSCLIADFYRGILEELFDDIAEIFTYSLDNGTLRELKECDLYVRAVTSYDLIHYSWAEPYFPPEERTVYMDLTFSRRAADRVCAYPPGTTALLVNQNRHMAMESISQLYHIGLKGIQLLPYAPEMETVPEAELAFAPGEVDLVPPGIQAVDLGPRFPTANTVCEIALKLGDAFFLESKKFARYTLSLADVDYSLQRISSDNLTMENKLEMILNTLDEGIVCTNENGQVNLINKTAQRLLGVRRMDALGCPAAEVFPELPFDTGASGQPRLLNVRGVETGVTITSLRIGDRPVGAFAVLRHFANEESRQTTLRLQKATKNHRARYTFDDIAGSSPAITKAKEIAGRMAGNDASVMLQGESGTGKELFAQAIHSASLRRDGPFIAVNCAALTETLLESELFGYVEGAFTGAKKGGKPGLFECAHQGTLFLDEIETMSSALQVKLLRVLQEREVVRIGSVDVIPVDVRILSATNEDLLRKVRQGRFRQDLYYRLSVIPLRLPPLRERREDILQLAETFLRQLGADLVLSDRVKVALIQHNWPGNVRELRNCMEYLMHMGRHMVDVEDLPETIQGRPAAALVSSESGGLTYQERRLLQILGELYRQHQGVGRQGLVRACVERGFAISEHEVRQALQIFQEHGWATIGRGRRGTHLTSAGYQRYQQLLAAPMEDEVAHSI